MRSIKNKYKRSKTVLFSYMINIKNIDLNLLKIDKKSYKNIDIYYTGYITVDISSSNIDYVNIHSLYPLYLIS